MRPLTVLLAASTLTLAATTLYFARAAVQERVRNDLTEARTGVSARAAGEAPHTAPIGDRPQPRVPGTNRPEGGADERADASNWMAARLEELRNPESRARAIEARARAYRDFQYRGADSYLGIPPGEFRRLMQVMAERMSAREWQILACDLDPGCDGRAERQIVNATHPLADLLPTEQIQGLQAFGDSLSERQAVERWRDNLAPTVAPSTDASLELALQLAEARQRFEQEANQRRERVLYHSGGIVSAAAPGAAGENAKRRESAALHARRMYDVASTILTTEQLGTFSAVLDKALSDSEATLMEREAAAVARGSAGTQPASQR